MNKQKMILAVIGGVFGVALLAMGYLVFSAYSSKEAALTGDEEEGIEGLETVTANAEQLLRKPVRPCQASVTAIESNVTAVSEWHEMALKQASRGDRFFDKTTAAAFKTMVVADAKRLAMLPGGAAGHVIKADFGFGPFHDYIGGGKMPDEAELPTLQRRWDDIANLIEVMAKCGVAEVTSVGMAAVTESAPAEAATKGGKPGGKKPQAKKPQTKKPQAKKVAGKDAAKADDARQPLANAYTIAFNAKPDALVRVVNALATCERFVVVENFGFVRSQDAIVQSLGGETKKTPEAATGSRRRRRGAQAAEEASPNDGGEDEKSKSGVVTDPALDGPLAVTMKVIVYDFRSVEETDDEKSKAKGDETTKEGKK